MTIKKLIIIFALTFFIPTISIAGLGANLRNGFEVYFPIDSKNYLIEPSIAIYNSKFKYKNFDTGNTIVEYIRVGIGILKTSRASKNMRYYTGARFGYIKEENFSFQTEGSGYFITPTLGLEYFLTSDFTLGLDIGLRYESYKTSAGSFDDDYTGTVTNVYTESSLILRYHF